MKKSKLVLSGLAIACVAVLSISLVACGSETTTSQTTITSSVSVSSTANTEPIVQSAVNELQSEFDSFNSENNGYATVTATADGNSIVVTMNFQVDASILDSSDFDDLAQEIEPDFSAAISELESVGVQSPSIILRMINQDGSELYNHTFTS